MACNIKRKCCNCKHFVVVSTTTITGGKLILNIPTATYTNGEEVCLFISPTLPVSATPIPVVVTIGTGTTQYPLINKCGNNVYSDQIKTRCIYYTSVRTDTKLFKYNGCKNLPCTSFVFPVIPVPTASV